MKIIAAQITSITQNFVLPEVFPELIVQIQPKPMIGMALSVLFPKRTVCYPKSPLG